MILTDKGCLGLLGVSKKLSSLSNELDTMCEGKNCCECKEREKNKVTKYMGVSLRVS